MMESRYVIIHGHFYQPPRESPWTGRISPEPGAQPFENWNERILSECYTANAHAHTMEGHVVHVRNNYEMLSFDVGPTLAAWLERHGQAAYRAMRRADQMSAGQRNGHGNAIAQSYSHSILPLLSERDRALEIAWGIGDFEYRFGRRPEGMWLPECAADQPTLRILAHAGIRFVILGADQGHYEPVGDGIEAGPFQWNEGDLSLAVMRFDRGLSAEIAFNDLVGDGARFAEAIANRALALRPGAALLIATDGETFGHHKRNGAAELARAMLLLERRDDIVVTNCAEYLARSQAVGGFRIDAASSWSCAHGVERWRADCGCRMTPGTSQQWRAPLRAAMEFVTNHADFVYQRFAVGLVADPEAALARSIILALDQRAEVQEKFFAEHRLHSTRDRERALTLFEMERAAAAALTSCGWFFDDFGGPEGRIVLRWAARAVELAAQFMPSVETELVERLRRIRSARREIGDAATLYLSLKTREARGRL